MALRMKDVLGSGLGQLRTHPLEAHVRAHLGDEIIVSTDHALLVWEPWRIVPTYAVPRGDVFGDLVPEALPTDAATNATTNATTDATTNATTNRDGAAGSGAAGGAGAPGASGGPEGSRASVRSLDPRTPFGTHTSPGRSHTVHTAGQGGVEGAAFAFDDPDLDGYVALDFAAFTAWMEEDDEVLGHPQDPFHRVACRRTSKHVVVTRDGEVLADTRRAVLLLETNIPGRYYIPRADVRQAALEPSSTRSLCPYKGEATYWTAQVGERVVPDLARSYEQPLTEAAPIAGHLCFWHERTDLSIDGEQVARPRTRWSEDPDSATQ